MSNLMLEVLQAAGFVAVCVGVGLLAGYAWALIAAGAATVAVANALGDRRAP